ncbi:MAG: DUF1857 family protein [Pseudonocardia sp.]|uniref:AtaL-like protein n=1 Tax=unclassified Pseudonocardia TaxID=2619320 RepID=UPI00086873B3|nr:MULTISPECIES: AtaL-like protein [unclassified Pseudonocardia]MBN9107427.1 DUF1857 family protein [Pseudonocardia sp.]ODV08296.1 MAG: hypothetical protein ABT15_03200 [Pseudonocardia sp. SCN 73-27]
MFEVSQTVPVNDDPDAPRLDRAQVWKGLLLKANDALPFVPQMESCHVVERGPDWLLRDILLGGVPLRERVTFEPEERVVFERIRGAETGRIENVIETDGDGELVLRFSFALGHEDLEPGSAAEAEHFAPMRGMYEGAVASTLAAVRRTAAEQADVLAAGPGTARPDVPAWMVRYYEAVDSLDLDGLLAQHTPDSTATVGNSPTMQGRAEIGAGLEQLFGLLREMRHTFVRTWEVDGSAPGETVGVLDARVSYLLRNGPNVTVPVLTLLTRTGGLVSDLRFCIDMAPVFAALAPQPADAAAAAG